MIVVSAVGQVMVVSLEQFWKQLLGIAVISSGNATDTRELQPEKTDEPIDTLFPIVAELNAVQPEKAYWPTETPFPMVTDVNAVQPE